MNAIVLHHVKTSVSSIAKESWLRKNQRERIVLPILLPITDVCVVRLPVLILWQFKQLSVNCLESTVLFPETNCQSPFRRPLLHSDDNSRIDDVVQRHGYDYNEDHRNDNTNDDTTYDNTIDGFDSHRDVFDDSVSAVH